MPACPLLFDQDLSIQHATLEAAGYKVVRAEKASGMHRGGRTKPEVLLDFSKSAY
jgi:hypothetical protein